jgi:hypothetical protein
MFIPWVGLFEQVKLADIFVHYDDVQLPQGRSFMARVQIKTPSGITWLTAPIDRVRSGKMINETFLVSNTDWRSKHLKMLQYSYSKAPYFDPMFELARTIYAYPDDNLAVFNRHAVEHISQWLGIGRNFRVSSELGVDGQSTQRLVDICRYFKADTYVTGLGALNYLDYSQFESNCISVRYMNYEKTAYLQLHGEFTPYVSILDAIAHCGHEASRLICSGSVYWRDYNDRQNQGIQEPSQGEYRGLGPR